MLDTMNAVAAIVPPGLRGQPSSEPLDVSRDVGDELKFEEQDVKRKECMTNDGYRILVKPASRTCSDIRSIIHLRSPYIRQTFGR